MTFIRILNFLLFCLPPFILLDVVPVILFTSRTDLGFNKLTTSIFSFVAAFPTFFAILRLTKKKMYAFSRGESEGGSGDSANIVKYREYASLSDDLGHSYSNICKKYGSIPTGLYFAYNLFGAVLFAANALAALSLGIYFVIAEATGDRERDDDDDGPNLRGIVYVLAVVLFALGMLAGTAAVVCVWLRRKWKRRLAEYPAVVALRPTL